MLVLTHPHEHIAVPYGYLWIHIPNLRYGDWRLFVQAWRAQSYFLRRCKWIHRSTKPLRFSLSHHRMWIMGWKILLPTSNRQGSSATALEQTQSKDLWIKPPPKGFLEPRRLQDHETRLTTARTSGAFGSSGDLGQQGRQCSPGLCVACGARAHGDGRSVA